MNNTQVSLADAYKVSRTFFESMSTELGSFSPNVKSRMKMFMGFMGVSPTTFFTWQDCYIKISHKLFDQNELVSMQKAFSIALAFASEYSYRLELDLFELNLAMNAMQNFPSLYKEEWKLWEKAIYSVLEVEKKNLLVQGENIS